MTQSTKFAVVILLLVAAGLVTVTLWRTEPAPGGVTGAALAPNEATTAPLGDLELAAQHEPGTHGDAPAPDTQAVTTASNDYTQMPLPELPGRDISFSLQFPDLYARAKAGDPVASCRLVLDSMRCADWQRSQQFNAMLTMSLSQNPNSKMTDLAIEALARTEVKDAQSHICADFDTSQLEGIEQLGPTAFARLSPRQKLLIAMTNESGTVLRLPKSLIPKPTSISFNDEYMVPQFLADHDRAFIADGLAARDPLALEAAMLLHTPRLPAAMIRGLRQAQPDPLKFAFYARLSRELLGDQGTSPFAIETLGKIEAKLSDAARQSLDQSVQAELPSWRAALAVSANSAEEIDSADAAAACGAG